MNIAIWIVIALFAVVLPSVALTNGGRREPGRSALELHARTVGLPLTAEVVGPVVARIRRRQRGMLAGGLTGIVLGTLVAILAGSAGTWGGALVMMLAGTGLGLGSAWAIAVHRPAATAERPVVARTRATRLADYLTGGERFGLWVAPVALLVGAGAGALLLGQLPAAVRGERTVLGLVGTALILVTWGTTVLVLRRVLAAPARSGSDLELAWDDAERADGLRQLAVLAVATAAIMLGLWLVLIGEALTGTGFYRDDLGTTYAITGISLAVFLPLIALVAAGPMSAWMSGRRRGYEQRRLWPDGVAAS